MTETVLPPKARTPLWRDVTIGANAGEFRLQHCMECGRVQYPPREICSRCLSDDLEWQPVATGGVVRSYTRIHATLEPWFKDRLPVDVALVEMDAGPVVYAFCDAGMETGTRVTIEARIDESGEAVLRAKARKREKSNGQ